MKLKAPFPWFGGKSRVAHLVWPRFGDTVNYVEPFFGSGAVLFGRPHKARNETVNDLDCYLANFWRALQEDPEGVALAADWPVNEADLHARHEWLHDQDDFRRRMHKDPDHFDVKVAGWWVWGVSAWIGDKWCWIADQNENLWQGRPNLMGGGQGVHRLSQKRPDIRKGGRGIQQKQVIGAQSPSQQLPDIAGNGGASGRGVHAKYARNMEEYFRALQERLRRVRVCCGQWSRILGPSPTIHVGITAVFLDPPYGVADRAEVYGHESLGAKATPLFPDLQEPTIADDVREWCIEKGEHPKLRIALCGYEGEHNTLEGLGWSKIAWRTQGGYGARNSANKNPARERIWFSPHCLQTEEAECSNT